MCVFIIYKYYNYIIIILIIIIIIGIAPLNHVLCGIWIWSAPPTKLRATPNDNNCAPEPCIVRHMDMVPANKATSNHNHHSGILEQ